MRSADERVCTDLCPQLHPWSILDCSGSEAPECWVTKRPVRAVPTANTRVYHHHRPPYQRSRRAAEGHLHGAGPMGHAAEGVGAPAAVPQPVRLGADAALVKHPDGARGGVAGLTLPPLRCLEVHKHIRRARSSARGQRLDGRAPTAGSAGEQGRTLQSLVSICSLQDGFWLDTRVETPAPQLWEQGLHGVLFSVQVVGGGTSLFSGWYGGRGGQSPVRPMAKGGKSQRKTITFLPRPLSCHKMQKRSEIKTPALEWTKTNTLNPFTSGTCFWN